MVIKAESIGQIDPLRQYRSENLESFKRFLSDLQQSATLLAELKVQERSLFLAVLGL
jgi:preprotein translocase subunit SecA